MLNSEWREVSLKDIASISLSGVDKHILPEEASVRLCNYLDVYRNRQLRSSHEFAPGSATASEITRFQLQKGDVLITKDSETPDDIGVPAVVVDDLEDVICGYHLALIRPVEGVDSLFLGYHLLSDVAKRHFMITAAGVTRFGLGVRAIASLPVLLPPPDEQAAIARILDAVDTAIARTLEAMERARDLTKSIMHNLLELGINEAGQARKKDNDEMIATELGLLSKTWQVKRLSDVAEVERGRFTPRPRNDPRFYNGPYPFVQTGLIAKAKGRVLYEYGQTLNEAGKAVSREFPAGTILVTIAANIGETAILGLPMCVTDSIVGVQVKAPHSPRFIEMCLRRLQPRLLALAPRSAQHNINLTTLKPLRLPIPPPREQARIAQLYDAADANVQAYEKKIDALIQLKRSLMHDLLTGKVRVNHLNLASPVAL